MTLATTTPWVRRLGTTTGTTLYCFPFAGGGIGAYRRWGTAFGPGVDVCAIQLPGRDERFGEQPMSGMDQVLDELVPALLPRLDRPYAFFGHSMGALMAFELSRRLRADHGTAPVRLFVSAHGAAHLPLPEGHRHTLGDADFLDSLRGTDDELDAILAEPELAEMFLPVLRADFTLCETYEYRDGPALACPISAFGGLTDPLVDRAGLSAWGEHTSAGRAQVRMFPGGHFYIRDHEQQVIDFVRRDLRTV